VACYNEQRAIGIETYKKGTIKRNTTFQGIHTQFHSTSLVKSRFFFISIASFLSLWNEKEEEIILFCPECNVVGNEIFSS